MFDLMSIFRQPQSMLTQQPQMGAQNMLTQPKPSFWETDRGQTLNDLFTGWAMGNNVQQSLGLGAQQVAEGRRTRKGAQQSAQQNNQTIQWLTERGMDPQQAAMVVSNPAVLADYLKQLQAPQDPNAALDADFKRAQIQNIQSQIDERNNPSVRDQFGLNPIYGKDANGNLVVMQPSKSGGLVRADIPEGVTLQPGVDKIDLGTAWGITDRSGSIISTIPKDLAGAEAQKAIGGKQGDAQFDLPRVEQNAQQTLGVLERMKTHPGRAGSTGFIEGILPSRTSDQVDFQSLVDQTQGQSFLQAFQMLKGAGQITEIEGTKATDAISRLRNQRLSDADYLRAINDLESVIQAGLARARQQAGGGTPGGVAPQMPDGGVDYKSKYGLD